MSITIETILSVIRGINERRKENFIMKPAKDIQLNVPIGIDSLALILKVKVEEIAPIIDEMVAFDILELVPEKKQINGGRKGWKKIKIKE